MTPADRDTQGAELQPDDDIKNTWEARWFLALCAICLGGGAFQVGRLAGWW